MERKMMINAWWFLFKKEFRLMRSFLLVNWTVLISGGLIGADLAYRTHSGMSSFFLFVVMVWHIFYLLVYLISQSMGRKKSRSDLDAITTIRLGVAFCQICSWSPVNVCLTLFQLCAMAVGFAS
jgi:hypothetical protein